MAMVYKGGGSGVWLVGFGFFCVGGFFSLFFF